MPRLWIPRSTHYTDSIFTASQFLMGRQSILQSAGPPRTQRAPGTLGTKSPSHTRRTDLHASNACQALENTASAVAAADVTGNTDRATSSHYETVNERGQWGRRQGADCGHQDCKDFWKAYSRNYCTWNCRNQKIYFSIPSRVQSEPSMPNVGNGVLTAPWVVTILNTKTLPKLYLSRLGKP